MSPYPISVLPHTIPQRLTIKGPHDHFRVDTVKVVPGTDKTPENGDQWYTLPVLIVDSSSNRPLNCAVALKGDKQAPAGKGTMVCYLTLNVVDERSQASADPPTLPTHHIERRSEYTANGRATFRMCFYTETSYLISVGVACVQDEEGVECAGCNVEQYTTVIRAVTMVEIGAFKRPPFLKFHGLLASKRFREIMILYRALHYKGKHDKTQLIRSKLTSDNVELDIRLYISALNVTDSSYDIAQGEELLKKCQTLDCQNGSLLQAYCLMSLATLYYDNGDKEKASEYIHYARSECYGAAPSYLTSMVFYCEARNLIRRHKGNVTPCVKGKAMRLFNCAIADSYYAVGWEKYVLCLCHIKMAMFCLSESIDYEFCPSSNYTPSDEYISLAEKHLKAVPKAIPVDELREMSWYAISYHIALSDLNRLREDTATAREHVKMAEKVLHDLKTAPKYTNKFGTPISSRLKYLEADPIDKILEEYNHK